MKFILCCMLFVSMTAVGGSPKVKTMEDAKALALETQKQILIEFYVPFCSSCKNYARAAKKDKDIKAALEKVVVLKLNAKKGEGKALKNKYDVPGFPTFILLNTNGEKMAEQIGYAKDDFLLMLETGKTTRF